MPSRKSGVAEPDTSTLTEETKMLAEATPVEMEEAADQKTSKKTSVIKGERLVGQALLDFVVENRHRPTTELVFEAGYYTKRVDAETGEEKISYQKAAFHEAINAANGIELAPAPRAYAPRKNRAPVVKLGTKGSIVVGSRHSSAAGFEPGSRVKVEAEPGRITLTAWEDDSTEPEEETDLDL